VGGTSVTPPAGTKLKHSDKKAIMPLTQTNPKATPSGKKKIKNGQAKDSVTVSEESLANA